jgi:uncharacterized protein (DUF2236 family)
MCERFGKPLTEAEKAQMDRESVACYARYGVSMRPVPPDYASFKRYWVEMLANLKPTPITDHALQLRRTPCRRRCARPWAGSGARVTSACFGRSACWSRASSL